MIYCSETSKSKFIFYSFARFEWNGFITCCYEKVIIFGNVQRSYWSRIRRQRPNQSSGMHIEYERTCIIASNNCPLTVHRDCNGPYLHTSARAHKSINYVHKNIYFVRKTEGMSGRLTSVAIAHMCATAWRSKSQHEE